MISAILVVKAGNSFMGEGGYKVDLLLILISISVLLSGPGRVSIEWDAIKREIFPRISYKKKNSNSDTKTLLWIIPSKIIPSKFLRTWLHI